MTVPPLVGTAGAPGTTSSSPSITRGLTIPEGALIVAFVHYDQVATISDNNGANAFTLAMNAACPESTHNLAIWTRFAGPSEPSSYAWSLSASRAWSIILRVYTGVDASIWDVAPDMATNGRGATERPFAIPGITTLTDDARAIAWIGLDSPGDANFFSGQTNGFGDERESGAGRVHATYDKGIASAGDVGDCSVTALWGTPQSTSGLMMALKAVGAGSPPPTVTSIDPTSGSMSGGTAVHIYGDHYTEDSEVNFGEAGLSPDVTFVDVGHLIAISPPLGGGEWSPLDGDTRPELFETVFNPTFTSGTEGNPTVYSYKRFVRAGSSTAVISMLSSLHDVVLDHCIIDPGFVGYLNTWNAISINHTASQKFNRITFRDCLIKGIYEAGTGYSLNRMGFECTGRPAPSASDCYQHVDLIRCVFEPQGAEAISYDGPEMAANCLIEDCWILGSGNHPNSYDWGQGFEINGPSHFTVRRLHIHPGRGAGTNLGGLDTTTGNCNWVFEDIDVRADYHPLQKVQRNALSQAVYAHDMHGAVWSGSAVRAESGGASQLTWITTSNNNNFTGMSWGSGQRYITGSGNTGI